MSATACSSGNSRPSVSLDEKVAVAQSKAEKRRLAREKWSQRREKLFKIVESHKFNASMSGLIFLNLIFVIMEVNAGADGSPAPKWLMIANLVVLCIYFLEVCAKAYIYRADFMYDTFAVLDLAVVVVDIVVTIIVALMPVSLVPIVLARVTRVLKVMRTLRAMSMFPEINALMKGLLFSSKTVLWGVVMLALGLVFWSIFATLFIHPIILELQEEGYWDALDCGRCARSFASVELSMLTLCQQLIVGEGWSDLNTPTIEKRPATAIFFVGAMVTLMLAAYNLLLGMIVERATEAKLVTTRELASKKDKEREQACERLYDLCEKLDRDHSGHLTLDELQDGFKMHDDFADLLTSMDIQEEELETVFTMLDQDGSGSVDYKEFVKQLHMWKSQEMGTLLHFIKFHVVELSRKVSELEPGQQQKKAQLRMKTLLSFSQLQDPWKAGSGGDTPEAGGAVETLCLDADDTHSI